MRAYKIYTPRFTLKIQKPFTLDVSFYISLKLDRCLKLRA